MEKSNDEKLFEEELEKDSEEILEEEEDRIDENYTNEEFEKLQKEAIRLVDDQVEKLLYVTDKLEKGEAHNLPIDVPRDKFGEYLSPIEGMKFIINDNENSLPIWLDYLESTLTGTNLDAKSIIILNRFMSAFELLKKFPKNQDTVTGDEKEIKEIKQGIRIRNAYKREYNYSMKHMNIKQPLEDVFITFLPLYCSLLIKEQVDKKDPDEIIKYLNDILPSLLEKAEEIEEVKFPQILPDKLSPLLNKIDEFFKELNEVDLFNLSGSRF